MAPGADATQAAALNKNSPRKSRCPGFVFDASIERSVRPMRLGYTKPHICCFTARNANTVRRADNNTRVELGYAELFIDVHPDPSFDFLIDPPTDASPDTLAAHNFFRAYPLEIEDSEYDAAERAFGLHIAFAAEILARQNRTCLFTVSVFGPLARLYRWDREGCVATAAFDFHASPGTLLEFFWRFAQVSSSERGHDPTTMVANPQAETLFREAIRSHVRAQLDVDGPELDKAVSAYYQPGHVSVIIVHPELAPEAETYFVTSYRTMLVSRPVVSPLHLEGRGTRGYWAVNPQTRRVMFLKDTWRVGPVEELEGDILARLNECNVRNIPRQDIHGTAAEDPDTLRTGQLILSPRMYSIHHGVFRYLQAIHTNWFLRKGKVGLPNRWGSYPDDPTRALPTGDRRSWLRFKHTTGARGTPPCGVRCVHW